MWSGSIQSITIRCAGYWKMTRAHWNLLSALREMRCVNCRRSPFPLIISYTVWRHQNCVIERKRGVDTSDVRKQAGICAIVSSVSAVHLHQGPTREPAFRLLRDYSEGSHRYRTLMIAPVILPYN